MEINMLLRHTHTHTQTKKKTLDEQLYQYTVTTQITSLSFKCEVL